MRSKAVLTVAAAVLFALSSSAGAATTKAPNNGLATTLSPEKAKAMKPELLSAIAALKGHINGAAALTDKQIEAHKLTIDSHKEIFGYDDAVIKACFDLVATYDDKIGPLWVARGDFNRKALVNDIHWTVYNVMQNIMDRVYTRQNILKYADIIKGFKFKCSGYFPGAVTPPADAAAAYTVKTNGSYPKTFGRTEDGFARRPTGAYLAPGSIATVTVPASMVGKGYRVRVGAHSWDFSNRPSVKRLDRSSLAYSINSADVKVASPLGGGIYIEVPYLAAAGIVDVKIANAVRSPFFSATSFHKTSLSEWQNTERNHKAPWADFDSDKFMMNVPTSWINKLDDPVTLMKNWDLAMDAMNDLMGLPHVRGRETMYCQVDLQMRVSVFAPGYPCVNDRYSPKTAYDGNVKHYLVRGPQYAPDYVFHEQGHGFGFVKFGGEMESTVNLLHVAVWNQKFGYSLDEAFRGSREGSKAYHTLDTTAVQWMTSLSFAAKKPMSEAEKAYQLKGHAKFVDIARLFGWKALNDFWYSTNVDFENGKEWSKHGTDIDQISLRLSEKAGADLTPLIHFWGTPPRDAAALKAAVAAAKLPPSAKIYDTLVHYKSLVPANNQAFRDFAKNWWGKQPSSTGFTTERNHAEQWEKYDEKTAAAITRTVQEIIDHYFPKGRPKDKGPSGL